MSGRHYPDVRTERHEYISRPKRRKNTSPSVLRVELLLNTTTTTATTLYAHGGWEGMGNNTFLTGEFILGVAATKGGAFEFGWVGRGMEEGEEGEGKVW